MHNFYVSAVEWQCQNDSHRTVQKQCTIVSIAYTTDTQTQRGEIYSQHNNLTHSAYRRAEREQKLF